MTAAPVRRPERVVVGIDPGARETGIVRRTATSLLVAHVHVRRDGDLLPSPDDLAALVDTVRAFVEATDTIAVETIRRPSPYMNGRRTFIEPLSYAATGAVYGAVAAAFPGRVTAVAPRKAGQLPRLAYPESIRPPTGGKGGDRNRHLRAAWDIAGQA